MAVELVFRRPSIVLAWCLAVSSCSSTSTDAMAQEEEGHGIIQSCGVDPLVDYPSMVKYGPWDDRNYALTAEDLEYLSPDEHELKNQLPAFFRVELRKEMPHLRRSGPAQYPRSALQLFYLRHGELRSEGGTGDDCPKLQ